MTMGSTQFPINPLGRFSTVLGVRIAAAASLLIVMYILLASSFSHGKFEVGQWQSPFHQGNATHDEPAAPSATPSPSLKIKPAQYNQSEACHPDHLGLTHLLAQLWRSRIHAPDSPFFTTDKGVRFDVPEENRIWTKPLGNRVVIIDVDTRVSEANADTLLNPYPISYTGMPGRTAGHLNHYLYSLIHGYDYRLIKAADYPDRHGTWVKVSIVREALKTHDYVVFLDSDAVFTHLELPLEWMMNLWNFKPHTLVAMAEDLDNDIDYDPQGKIILNTGFLIAQASERTTQMMDMWETCPQTIEGCNHWTHNWAHEQSAFSYYIRYRFQEPDEVRNIPCAHANGNEYYEDGKGACRGHFISHLWSSKDKTVEVLQRSVMKMLVNRLHNQFKMEQSTLFVDGTGVPYPIEDLHV